METSRALFGFEDALDADSHGRGAMRKLVFSSASL